MAGAQLIEMNYGMFKQHIKVIRYKRIQPELFPRVRGPDVVNFYKKKVYTNANVLENIISYHIYVTTLAMNCIQSIITLDMFDS